MWVTPTRTLAGRAGDKPRRYRTLRQRLELP
jgi:hypothetical protein